VKGRECVDGDYGWTNRIVAIRRLKHPSGQHTDRVIRETAEDILAVPIALAATDRQRLAMERMPPIRDRDTLKMMGIMWLARPVSARRFSAAPWDSRPVAKGIA
jgi:hypothetical protein